MDPNIRTVTVNGRRGGATAAAPWIHALGDTALVREKAGFLFKASFEREALHLAVAPSLIEGARSHHYDMTVPGEEAFTLVGDVNAEGVFTMLFKPDRVEDIAANAAAYVAICRRFAAFIISAGYSGAGELGDVTQGMLLSLGVTPVPRTLRELTAGASQ